LYNTTRTCKEGKWEKKRFVGFELGGKTLGIIGIGRIGQELARMANGIGMKVIAHCRNKPCDLPSFVEFTDKDTLLAKSDFVSFHTPFAGTPLCSIEEFKKMKKTAYIVNCARGGVVCEKSLLEALNNGIIAGAAIDVFEKEPTENFELLNHEKVFAACPHVGAQTGEAQDRVGDEVVSIVKEFMK
ncbi:MAG: NAD(P)-dependent oxidoreductase, partial [Candidatus Muiribacteriota bacterium]